MLSLYVQERLISMSLSKEPLGRLERVSLREYWEREDTAFTPWLAQDENIQLLSQAVGMELEVVNQEVRVGPFRADILCQTPDGSHQVLIENQLEVTDHGHLGQLMTYAAGLDAVSIVWIASRFTEEHRAALDWLNRITREGINFFGIEVELWRIGDSSAAPKFNLVSQPNDWAKSVAGAAKGATPMMTPRKQLQLEFWTAFNEYLGQQNTSFKPVKPQPTSWLLYAMGTTFFELETVANYQNRWLGVRLSFPVKFYPIISEDKEALDAEVGESMAWSQARTVGIVVLSRPVDFEVHSAWPEFFNWLLASMEKVAAVFRPRVSSYKERFQDFAAVELCSDN
jgi:hypothetical protein